MNARSTRQTLAYEQGFVLATVLVFLVVLSLTAFFAAGLTRSDVQVVNNLQNEREALYVAEAGVNEALYRLKVQSPACVPISGVGGSSSCVGANAGEVDTSLLTRYRTTCTPAPSAAVAGSSPFGLDVCVPTSRVQILFNTASASNATSDITAPTLQLASYPLRYSTTASDFVSPIPPNLQLEWDLCTAGDLASTPPRYGCTALNPIRRYPRPGCSELRNIVKITSTGNVRRADGSVVASRRVVVHAADIGENSSGLPSIITSLPGCTQGIAMNGTATVSTAGSIQVNAGVGATTDCTESIQGQNNNSVTACTAYPNDPSACSIGVSGVGADPDPTYSPAPNPLQEAAVDPFNDPTDPSKTLVPPAPFNSLPATVSGLASALQSSPSGCTGTALNPVTCPISSPTTLSPGIYWGGIKIMSADVTFSPGVYVLAGGLGSISGPGAGGALSLGSGGQTVTTTYTGTIGSGITSGGITFYNTSDPYATNGYGAAGTFTLGTGNATATFVASAANPTAPDGSSTNLKGILLFQDRTLNPPPTVDLTGGNSGNYTIDGIIYAWGAPATLAGHTNEVINTSLVVGSLSLSGGSNINIGSPSTATGACSSTGYTAIAWQDF
jgi:hypothetical protein